MVIARSSVHGSSSTRLSAPVEIVSLDLNPVASIELEITPLFVGGAKACPFIAVVSTVILEVTILSRNKSKSYSCYFFTLDGWITELPTLKNDYVLVNEDSNYNKCCFRNTTRRCATDISEFLSKISKFGNDFLSKPIVWKSKMALNLIRTKIVYILIRKISSICRRAYLVSKDTSAIAAGSFCARTLTTSVSSQWAVHKFYVINRHKLTKANENEVPAWNRDKLFIRYCLNWKYRFQKIT